MLAPAYAENTKPTDEGPTSAPSAPAKIRRTETIVDDNWTVTCTQTDQGDTKRLCSAALRIAQTDNTGTQRVVFTWVMGRQEGKLVSAISVPTGLQIPPGMEVKIGDKETRKLGFSICQPDHCEALLPLDAPAVKSLGAAATTEKGSLRRWPTWASRNELYGAMMCLRPALRRRASAMMEIQIPRKEIQIFRKDIQAGRNKIQIRAERNPNSNPSIPPSLNRAFSMTCADPRGHFYF